MEDLFKKFIFAGVGFVSRTNDRVQQTINQLVEENKLSQSEGQKIMDALQKNTDTKRKEFETQINSVAKRVMKTMGVASNAEVEELKRAVKGPSGKVGASASASTGEKKTATAKKAAESSAAAPKKAASSKSASAKKSAAAPAAEAGASSADKA